MPQLHLFRFFCQREDRQITDGCCFCMNIRISAILLKWKPVLSLCPIPFPHSCHRKTFDALFRTESHNRRPLTSSSWRIQFSAQISTNALIDFSWNLREDLSNINLRRTGGGGSVKVRSLYLLLMGITC